MPPQKAQAGGRVLISTSPTAADFLYFDCRLKWKMLEKDVHNSCLTTIKGLRVSLVNELEEQIDSLLEVLVTRKVFNRDDREDVLAQPGPRRRVRKVLDILECKGEEAAQLFLSIRCHHQVFSKTKAAGLQGLGTRHHTLTCSFFYLLTTLMVKTLLYVRNFQLRSHI